MNTATNETQLRKLLQWAQQVMAHAWMVRTFVKHADEIEDFPELMQLPRAVFDTARALETRVDEPEKYFIMLNKKIGKLRKAVEQFHQDAPLVSTHTNYQQAVISMDACLSELESLLETANQVLNNNS